MTLLEGALWVVGLAAGLFILDRALLFLEGRGWIYYRRSKAGRGASTYHLLEWTSVLDPSQKQVLELRVSEERQEDESGGPLGEGAGRGGADPEGGAGPEGESVSDEDHP